MQLTPPLLLLAALALTWAPRVWAAGAGAALPATAELASAGSPTCAAGAKAYVACGGYFRFDTRDACLARGCCWQPSARHVHWCFYPADAPAVRNITTVHVVQGCHLDVGFVGPAFEGVFINLFIYLIANRPRGAW